MFVFLKSIDKRFRALIITAISILVFAAAYSFCNDEEFITWIGSYYQAPTVRIMYLTDLFNKVGEKKNGGDMMSRKTFLGLPIFKDDEDVIYVLRGHDVRTRTERAKKLREDIFDVMDNKEGEGKDNVRGFIRRSTFIGLPLNMKLIGQYASPSAGKLNYTEIAENKNYKFGLLDRLYFSVITQSTIGFGDVVPASRRVRLLAALQAVSTLVIVFLHG